MSSNLLVGTDGSECGERALEFAANRAQCGGENLIIAYVIEWSPYTFNTPSENEERHKRREEEIARAQSEIINPLVQRFSELGINVTGVVRHGHAANTLDELGRAAAWVKNYGGPRGTGFILLRPSLSPEVMAEYQRVAEYFPPSDSARR